MPPTAEQREQTLDVDGYPYAVVITHDAVTGTCVVRSSFPAVIVRGKTVDEAMANAKQVIQSIVRGFDEALRAFADTTETNSSDDPNRQTT